MMLKKTFKIFYWTLACLISAVYLSYKASNIDAPADQRNVSDFIMMSEGHRASNESEANLWLLFADDNTKLLEDEEKSIEVLAIVFEQSLTKAVDNSLAKMNSPKDDFLSGLKYIIDLEAKVKYSETKIKEIEENVIKTFKALDYIKRQDVQVDREYVKEVAQEGLLSEYEYLNLSHDLVVLDNVRSIREFLLNALLCSENPHIKLKEIIDNRTIRVHNSTGTFMVNKIVSDGKKIFDSYHQNSIHKFINQPRWNLWAPSFNNANGFVAKTLNLVGVGGTIKAVVLETRASNIVRANGMLKVFMEDLKNHA